MTKRHVFLHIGPEPVRLGDTALDRLAEAGVTRAPASANELLNADIELRRLHASVGLRRRDVEGAWARVCRRTFRHGSDTLLSMPGLFAATAAQADLAHDGLLGMKAFLLVTTGAEGEVPSAWTSVVKPSRIRVLPAGLAGDDFAAQVAAIAALEDQRRLWKRLARRRAQRRAAARQLAA